MQGRTLGLQFHPEVTHTVQGKRLLHRFVHELCGCDRDWNMPDYVGEAVARIRAQVGKGRVVCGLSGGVDSSVAAVLIHEAIGDQLTCVFVDTGLLRKNEADQVVTLFRDHYNIPLVHADASQQFLKALAGVTDPEKKRKTIGALFIDVFEAEAKKIAADYYSDSADALNSLAWSIVDPDAKARRKSPDYALAISIADCAATAPRRRIITREARWRISSSSEEKTTIAAPASASFRAAAAGVSPS